MANTRSETLTLKASKWIISATRTGGDGVARIEMLEERQGERYALNHLDLAVLRDDIEQARQFCTPSGSQGSAVDYISPGRTDRT